MHPLSILNFNRILSTSEVGRNRVKKFFFEKESGDEAIAIFSISCQKQIHGYVVSFSFFFLGGGVADEIFSRIKSFFADEP